MVLVSGDAGIATGRVPYTDGLGLESAGVALERGRIIIDGHFATNIAGAKFGEIR